MTKPPGTGNGWGQVPPPDLQGQGAGVVSEPREAPKPSGSVAFSRGTQQSNVIWQRGSWAGAAPLLPPPSRCPDLWLAEGKGSWAQMGRRGTGRGRRSYGTVTPEGRHLGKYDTRATRCRSCF